MTQSLVVSVSNHASAGGKKRSRDALCRSWGPKNLRRQSEIDTGSLALTTQVRSGRDHSEREHVDHRNGSKHPEKGSGVLFMSMPSRRRPLPCLGQKREALAAVGKGKVVSWSTEPHLCRGM